MNNKYTRKENDVLTMISEWCSSNCGNVLNCSEGECVLYNIEQVITTREDG